MDAESAFRSLLLQSVTLPNSFVIKLKEEAMTDCQGAFFCEVAPNNIMGIISSILTVDGVAAVYSDVDDEVLYPSCSDITSQSLMDLIWKCFAITPDGCFAVRVYTYAEELLPIDCDDTVYFNIWQLIARTIVQKNGCYGFLINRLNEAEDPAITCNNSNLDLISLLMKSLVKLPGENPVRFAWNVLTSIVDATCTLCDDRFTEITGLKAEFAGVEGYYLADDFYGVIHLDDAGNELGRIEYGENCLRVANYYSGTRGPHIQDDSFNWTALIVYNLLGAGSVGGGTQLDMIGSAPANSMVHVQYSTDSGSTWFDAATFTEAAFQLGVSVTIGFTSFRTRLQVFTDKGCEYISVVNTFTE